MWLAHSELMYTSFGVRRKPYTVTCGKRIHVYTVWALIIIVRQQIKYVVGGGGERMGVDQVVQRGNGPGTRKARHLFEIILHTHARTHVRSEGKMNGGRGASFMSICFLEDRLDEIIITFKTKTRALLVNILIFLRL